MGGGASTESDAMRVFVVARFLRHNSHFTLQQAGKAPPFVDGASFSAGNYTRQAASLGATLGFLGASKGTASGKLSRGY